MLNWALIFLIVAIIAGILASRAWQWLLQASQSLFFSCFSYYFSFLCSRDWDGVRDRSQSDAKPKQVWGLATRTGQRNNYWYTDYVPVSFGFRF